jgi:hypothetical protein
MVSRPARAKLYQGLMLAATFGSHFLIEGTTLQKISVSTFHSMNSAFTSVLDTSTGNN